MTPQKILHIDDDQFMLRLCTTILGKAGYEVTPVFDPREVEALALDTFDLIILDLMMPFLDGFEILQLVRDHGYERPVLALSCKTLLPTERRMLEENRATFLMKPIGPMKLIHQVQTILAG